MYDDIRRYLWDCSIKEAIAEYKELQPSIEAIWAKEATLAHRMGELTQLLPADPANPLPLGIPSDPSALKGMLLGGLAGAGIGYGLGALADTFMPHQVSNNIRGRLALTGGVLGMSPGLMAGLSNMATDRPFNKTDDWTAKPDPAAMHKFREEAQKKYMDKTLENYNATSKLQKMAGMAGGGFDAMQFTNMVWNDPRVSRRLTLPIQASAAGLVEAAAQANPVNTVTGGGWVTPSDVGRVAMGMGAGYVSGALAGRALGILMGTPPATQETLKNTGAMAGFISAIIPKAFGS